jgi:hypothetical protein
MRSTTNHNSPLKPLLLGAILVLAACSQAAPYLNTLAWTRYLNADQAKILVDGSGNTYVVYQSPVLSGTNVSFLRYDPSGNVTASHSLFTRTSLHCQLEGVYLSPPSAPKTSLYVTMIEVLPSTDEGTVIDKSDLSGNVVWQSSFNQAMAGYSPVGGFVDSSDNFRLAFAFVPDSGPGSKLQMLEFSPTGTILSNQANTNMLPSSATFINGKWCVCGLDATSNNMFESGRWGSYDPSTGVDVAGAVFDELDNGTYTYEYGTPRSYVDPAGAVDIGITVTAFRDSDHQMVATNHFIRRYNLTGSLQWTSPSVAGYATFLTSFGSNNPQYYMRGEYQSPTITEQYDHLGNKVWTTSPLTSNRGFAPVADATGVFEFYEDSVNHKKINFIRVNSAGSVVWTSSLAAGAGGGANIEAYVNDAADVNNNLYSATVLPQAAGNQIVVQRFVPGVALSLLSTTGSSFNDGANVPVKVQLNSPAPAGGVLVKLTSSSAKELFSNNTTAYTVAIPAGSLFATVVMHPMAVSANTPVTVLGNQSGVQRAVSFTVTP